MTTTDPADVARAVAAECARCYQDVFGDRLVAAYLLGSLAYGDYAAPVSDVDLALVLADRRDTDPGIIETTTDSLRVRSDVHRKLSPFWGSLTALRDGHEDGRFPALDRLQLADHGVLLLGRDVSGQVNRPTAEDVLLDSARFAVDVLSTDEVISEFHRPRRLLKDPVWFTKAVLFPVRFLYTSTTAARRAATNAEAVAWYLAGPRPTAASLVRLATRVRAGHPLDPAPAAAELAAGLTPLYLQYIDDQTPRLIHANAPADLITAVTGWRRRLT